MIAEFVRQECLESGANTFKTLCAVESYTCGYKTGCSTAVCRLIIGSYSIDAGTTRFLYVTQEIIKVTSAHAELVTQ